MWQGVLRSRVVWATQILLAGAVGGCADDAETVEDVDPGIVDDGKSDFVSTSLTRIEGALDIVSDEVQGSISSPFRFHGYTFVAEAGMSLELQVTTTKKGRYYFYGPAHRVDGNGVPRFKQEQFKVDTEAGKLGKRTLEIKEDGTYMVVVGARGTLSTSYTLGLHCVAGCETEATLTDLVAAFGNDLALDDLVHPKWGVHIIHRPGAIDTVQRYETIAAFEADFPGRNISTQPRATMTVGALPDFDCDTGFAATGGFVEEVSGVTPLVTQMTSLNEIFAEPESEPMFSQSQIDAAREVDALIGAQALVTDNGITYYFAKIDGLWFLVAIDLDRFSCSA